MAKPWKAGAFVGSIVLGGAAYFYIPDAQIERLDMVERTEFIRGKKMFLRESELTQLNPENTNELIILGENFVEGRYEAIYFTNKNDFNEWRKTNVEIRKNINAN